MRKTIEKIEHWLWMRNFHPLSWQGYRYYPIGGGDPVTAIVAGTVAAAGGSAAISGSRQKKAARNAADLARNQQEQVLAEQKRLEEKYGLTPGELSREQRLFGDGNLFDDVMINGKPAGAGDIGLEARTQGMLEERVGKTGEELLREAGPDTTALLDKIASRFGMTGEELFMSEGEIPSALRNQILAQTKDPEKFYEDALGSNLELARQMVNQEANRRGVFGGTPEGGIRFENLGRAGVDLAIKSAQGRIDARQQALANASALSSSFLDLAKGARSESAIVGQSAISAKDKAREELNQFLTLMESASAGAKGRAATVGTNVFNTTQDVVGSAYNNLIGIEGYKGGIQTPAEGGLNMIASLGAGYLGGLPTTTSTKPSSPSYDQLMQGQGSNQDSLMRLSDITGNRKRRPVYIRGN